ncbi:unnamed protein product [Prunus brigantina]
MHVYNLGAQNIKKVSGSKNKVDPSRNPHRIKGTLVSLICILAPHESGYHRTRGATVKHAD